MFLQRVHTAPIEPDGAAPREPLAPATARPADAPSAPLPARVANEWDEWKSVRDLA